MRPRLIRQHCPLAVSAQQLLKRAMQTYGLSARAYDHILNVARTIADLSGAESVNEQHLEEAVNYRTMVVTIGNKAGADQRKFSINISSS